MITPKRETLETGDGHWFAISLDLPGFRVEFVGNGRGVFFADRLEKGNFGDGLPLVKSQDLGLILFTWRHGLSQIDI